MLAVWHLLMTPATVIAFVEIEIASEAEKEVRWQLCRMVVVVELCASELDWVHK